MLPCNRRRWRKGKKDGVSRSFRCSRLFFFFFYKTMGEVEDLTLAAQRKEGIREKNVQIHILN